VYFKFSYEIRSYKFAFQDAQFAVDIAGDQSATVILSQASSDEGQNEGKPARHLIQVLMEVDPPPKAAQALRGRATNLPSHADYFDDLPGPLKDFSDRLYGQITDIALDALGLIRWRFSAPGPVRPFSNGKLEWSDDNATWHRVPNRITLHVSAPVIQQKTGESQATEIARLLSGGTREPLAHALLREAQENADAKSYSSALIMAVAALEIGAKHIIAELAPNAEWLAFNAPSPPIEKIVKDYIPTLPARLHLDGSPVRAPSSLLKTLKDAVTARNSAVHAGSITPKVDFIDRVLAAVSDMLYIFDFYAGHKWAFERLSSETRTALTSASQGNL
jgi:hypothetical protein